jgi:hypothetical protein
MISRPTGDTGKRTIWLKAVLVLISGVTIGFAALGCDSDRQCAPGTTTYKIAFANSSSSEVTSINLRQIGSAEKVFVHSLPMGQSTGYFEFHLPIPRHGETLPITYGDYEGKYTHQSEIRPIFIFKPLATSVIRFDDGSYSVEKDAAEL